MPDEITTLLDEYHIQTLLQIAQHAGLTESRMKKTALVKLLHEKLFTATRIQTALTKLTDLERGVLARLQQQGGRVATRAFKQQLVLDGLVENSTLLVGGAYYRKQASGGRGVRSAQTRPGSRVFEDIIARLTLAGLVFSSGTGYSSGQTLFKVKLHPGETLYIPAAVLVQLPELDVPAAVSQGKWEPDRVIAADPNRFLRDLYLYWDYVRQNDVQLLKSGLVGKRPLKAINQILIQPDETLKSASREDETVWLFLLRLLLETLSLVEADEDALYPVTAAGWEVPAFWRMAPAAQVRACVEAWRTLSEVNEMAGTRAGVRDLSGARQVLLNLLRMLPVGVWTPLEMIHAQMLASDENFFFANRSVMYGHDRYFYGAVGDMYFRNADEALQQMNQFEQLFIRRCVARVLHPLGLVMLGYAAGAADWSALQLTPLGEAVLRDAATPPDPGHTARLIVQPNFQIMALGPLPLDVVAQLDLFAERQRIDHTAIEFLLTRESVYAAQQRHIPVAEIADFLAQAADTALPQNVARSLAEWGASHERITFRRGATLLQTATPEALAALLADTAVKPHLAPPLAPAVTRVRGDDRPALLAALLARGILPVRAGADPATADGSVTVDAAGVVTPLGGVPGLHLHGRLARVAEPLPDGRWQVTETAVRAAGGSRARVLAVLDELGRLQRGELPAALVAHIKAWGGYYGGAKLAQLTLVEFDSQAILDELLAHPDLAPHLKRFEAGKRALAVVTADALDAVQTTLRHLGVPLKTP